MSELAMRNSDMRAIDVQDYARQLFEACGQSAIAIAAERSRALESSGQDSDAQIWRRIEAALKLIRGPSQS